MFTTTVAMTRAALAPALAALSGAHGKWMEANGISTAAGRALSATLRFSQPVVTDRLHAAMNGEGARFSFRSAPGRIEINHAALLRR